MMRQVNIHEAKTHLSKLINDVLNGQEIVIAKSGKPLIVLSKFEDLGFERKGGQYRGLLKMGDDFDAPLPDDIAKSFQGEGTD